MAITINNLVNDLEFVFSATEKQTYPKLGLRTKVKGDYVIITSFNGGFAPSGENASLRINWLDVTSPVVTSAMTLSAIIQSYAAELTLGGGGSAVYTGQTYIGKAANGDFVTAYNDPDSLIVSSLPTGVTALYTADVEAIVRLNSAGEVLATYTKANSTFTIAANVITVTGESFGAGNTFVVYTNIPRPAAAGGGGAGGGAIVYSNMAGDFTATITNATPNITITGLPFTLEAGNVAMGSIKKKAVTTNTISTLNPSTISVSGGVITLGGIPNFATGDEVYVTLIGTDKAYDTGLDSNLVIVQNPCYAHTTGVEQIAAETAFPGLTATTDDGGGGATSIVDTAAPFTLAQVTPLIGYRVYSVTDGTYGLIASWTSTTTIVTTGGTVASFANDAYKMPVAKYYEVNMDTYNYLTFHYRLTADLNTRYTLQIWGTLDATAVVDSDVNWVNLSANVLGATAGIIADGILAGATAIKEDLVVLDTPTPMLKYMFKLVAEGKAAAASGSSASIFIKKSS